jgi:hypothetical protein
VRSSYGAWLLCALVLLLCLDARLARYGTHQRNLKVATTQSYLDGSETLRRVPNTTFPLLWLAAAIASLFGFAGLRTVSLTVCIPAATPLQRFDPVHYSRPPPGC